MKKLLFILILITFAACDPIDRFQRMSYPIVLVAESCEGDVTLCDAWGEYVTLSHSYYAAKTISASYDKGDTLIYIKTKSIK